MIPQLLWLLLRGTIRFHGHAQGHVLLPHSCSEAASLFFCWCQEKRGALALFFYLPGLLGLGRAREVGAAGMTGRLCRATLAAGFSPASLPRPRGMFGSQERLGMFLPLLFVRRLRWLPGFGLGGTFESGSVLLSMRRSHPRAVCVHSRYSASSWVLGISVLISPWWGWLGHVPGAKDKSLPSLLPF